MLDLGVVSALNRMLSGGLTKVVVSDEYKLVYIPIGKNSNSYIKSLLLRNLYEDYDPVWDTPISYQKKTGNHLYRPLKSARLSDKYDRLILLRDPFKRFLSGWYDKAVNKYPDRTDYLDEIKGAGRAGTVTFEEFVDYVVGIPDWRRNHHFRSQSYYFSFLEKYEHIGRVENLNKTIQYLNSKGLKLFCEEGLQGGVLKNHVMQNLMVLILRS